MRVDKGSPSVLSSPKTGQVGQSITATGVLSDNARRCDRTVLVGTDYRQALRSIRDLEDHGSAVFTGFMVSRSILNLPFKRYGWDRKS